jgi:hypothetical protein
MIKLLHKFLTKDLVTIEYYDEDSYNIKNAREGVKYLFNYGGNDWRLGEFCYFAGSDKFFHTHNGNFFDDELDVFKFAIPLDIFEGLTK